MTDPEPLPDKHPVWSAPNLFITTHFAGGGARVDENVNLRLLTMRENLKRYVAGEKMYSLVDFQRGS